jgi:hypothetical protein
MLPGICGPIRGPSGPVSSPGLSLSDAGASSPERSGRSSSVSSSWPSTQRVETRRRDEGACLLRRQQDSEGLIARPRHKEMDRLVGSSQDIEMRKATAWTHHTRHFATELRLVGNVHGGVLSLHHVEAASSKGQRCKAHLLGDR